MANDNNSGLGKFLGTVGGILGFIIGMNNSGGDLVTGLISGGIVLSPLSVTTN